MKADIYFDRYRPAKEYDGSPVQIGKVGAATLYKASDDRSGAPVVLTLLPVDQIEDEKRTSFEEQAQATLLLDHINVARTVEFGREGDNYAFISEYPQGETLKVWVDEKGPMSPDAVLRVALQVVSALGAASFHRVVHRGISPSNIVIVSGQTAEGGWPAVKLLNFPVAGMTRGEKTPEAAEFASPEQLGAGTVDFRSELYSLGGTMCYLLTGSFYAAEPRSLQTKRFAKALRRLITPMLRQDPHDRPQDPVLVAQELRSGLQKVERRQNLARRFGIPFVPVATRPIRLPKARRPRSILAAAIERPVSVEPVPVPAERTRRLWPRRALAIGVILLAAATVAAVLLPAPVSMILHRNRDVGTIGVTVGVPQTAASTPGGASQSSVAPAAAVAPNAAPNELTSAANLPPKGESEAPAATPPESTTQAARIVSAQPPPPPPSSRGDSSTTPESKTEVATEGNGSSAKEKIAAKNSSSETLSQSEGPSVESERSTARKTGARVAQRSEAESDHSAANVSNDRAGDEQAGAPEARSTTRNKPATTTSRHRSVSEIRRALPAEPFSPDEAPRSGYRGSVRAQFAGMTPDGGIVLRFPNGQTAVVPPPPGEYVPGQHRPRRSRRVIIERGPVEEPPQPAIPVFPPDA